MGLGHPHKKSKDILVKFRGLEGASLVAQLIKNRPAMQETLVQFLGWRRSPGEGIGYPLQYSWASLVAQMVKNQLAVLETRV